MRQSRRAVLAASIGNILEWFDFTLYAYFSPYIAAHFFPAASEATSFLVTIATFGVGFIARPVGAAVFGSYGDRVGRKAVLTWVVLLMALGTLMIGVMPSYSVIGVSATVLVVLARVIQGFASGGEWSGATSYIIEQAPSSRRGLFGSYQQASLAVALLMGSLSATVLASLMPAGLLQAWGWRVPFIAGALLIGGIGLWLRRSLPEGAQQADATIDRHSKPVREVLATQRRPLCISSLFTIGWTVTNYLYLVYMPLYLTRSLGIPTRISMMAAAAQVVCFMIGSPVMGRLSDAVGRRIVMSAGALCVMLGTYPAFLYLASHPTAPHVVGTLCILGIFMSMLTGAAPAWQAELFPARVRNSAISLSYNVTVTLFGGFAPFIATWLIGATGSVMSLTWYIAAGALASLIAIRWSRETAWTPLS